MFGLGKALGPSSKSGGRNLVIVNEFPLDKKVGWRILVEQVSFKFLYMSMIPAFCA